MNNKEGKAANEEVKTKKKKAEPITFNFPPIDYEALKRVPSFIVEVRYAAGKATDNPILEISLPIDITLCQIAKLIEEKHNNSLRNLRLYLGREEALNKVGSLNDYFYKQFNEIKFQEEKKIKGGEIIKIFYDFDACQHPLLEANFL